MSFRNDDLVVIHDLKSEQGKMLNGSLGKIVDCSNPPRFGVKIYSTPATTSMGERLPLLYDQMSAKSFNEINLTRHDDCCPLYLELLLHVVTTSLQTRHRMDIGTKFLREYVRREPNNLPMAATLANIVREAGECAPCHPAYASHLRIK
jgi:hypothetical protein